MNFTHRFYSTQRPLPTIYEHPEIFPELQQHSPDWAPPKHPNFILAATPEPKGYRWVQARWVQDKREYQNVNRLAIPVICWKEIGN